MLIIKKLYLPSLLTAIVLAGVIQSCKERKDERSTGEKAVELDSAKDFFEEDEKEVYDYQRFVGIYDHESTTKGFSAVLSITESGNDLDFMISVAQGACKGQAEGKIKMVSHEENYYVGFYEFDECPLQFTLLLGENKIDVKEVNLCRLHESSCVFEGAYAKRKN